MKRSRTMLATVAMLSAAVALSGQAGISTWHRPLMQPSPPWQSSAVRHSPGCMQLPSMQ